MPNKADNQLFLNENTKIGRVMGRAVFEKVQIEGDLLLITISYGSYPDRFPRKVQNEKANLQNGMAGLQNGKALLQKL
ncbi:MAG: hypothetical protein M5R36_25915 [Deltaproteobacteria bacterium]|nr:hypothetical protein [Deltaproteobacteria bacterium]